MKKSLVALAALAAVSAASAQSSVTLFGVVDAAISGYSNKAEDLVGNRVTTSSTGLSNSGYNSSRLGFRGTEDLGGGMAASFWLEAGLNNDTGSGADGGGLQFNRRSTVSLSGPFGEVRLGRDYTPSYWNDTTFDPFGANGVGTNLIVSANAQINKTTYRRASNSVGYFLPPNLGGFYGQVMYAFHENTKYDPAILTPDVPNSQRTGRYIGGRFGYANGPLDVALSYGESTVGDDFFLGVTNTLAAWNLGASYDFGPVKLFGEYSDTKEKIDWSNPLSSFVSWEDPNLRGWLIGATVPVGPGLIRASYSSVRYRNVTPMFFNDPKADKFAIGYVHNLSKRTALYATVARVSNKDGASLSVGGPDFFEGLVPKTSTGYDFGLRHSF